MSLAQLLSLGKKEDEEEKEKNAAAEKESKSEAPPPAAAAASSSSSAPAVKNIDELKVLQEFTQTQSKLSQEEAERRQAEEERLKKQAIDDAAKAAAEMARRQKIMSKGNNPFSTGGQEFTRGVWVCDTAFGTSTPKGARSTMQDFPMAGMAAMWAGAGFPRPMQPNATASSMRERSRSPMRADSSESSWGPGGCWPADASWGAWPGPGGCAAYGKGGSYGADGSAWGGYDAGGGYSAAGCPGWGPVWGGGKAGAW
mmetsp:Transcript_24280/g.53429  ORF Transcript_24280/g.53429 Transcript_24280/m.53429 type:complete len:256 (+) Transcript_24280:92-859(+)